MQTRLIKTEKMEPVMIFVIAAIVAAIFLVVFNKQQENKMSSHLFSAEVQQLYLISAAEYKINLLSNEIHDATADHLQSINTELNQLSAAFKNGEIALNELNLRLDHLFDRFDNSTNQDSFIAQAC